jgi:hypothetical protein
MLILNVLLCVTGRFIENSAPKIAKAPNISLSTQTNSYGWRSFNKTHLLNT